MSTALDLAGTPKELTGPQKAAVLVMYLEPPVARALIQHLSTEEVHDIGTAMATVHHCSPDVIETVIADFVSELYSVAMVPKTGKEFALDVLPDLLDDRRKHKVRSSLRRTISTAFADYIETRPPRTIATLLMDEHPQTLAIALLLMGSENAANVLSYMDEQEQFEIAMRMAMVERIPGELADDVEDAIRAALEDHGAGLFPVEGIDETAQILGRLAPDFQEPLLERISTTDFELSEILKRRMLLFKDLAVLDNKSIQTLLKGIDRQVLINALRGAEPELVELFLGNMSSRAADDIRDEMEIMGAIPRGEVESAQEEVVQTALNLAEEGTLRLPIGGGDDMV